MCWKIKCGSAWFRNTRQPCKIHLVFFVYHKWFTKSDGPVCKFLLEFRNVALCIRTSTNRLAGLQLSLNSSIFGFAILVNYYIHCTLRISDVMFESLFFNILSYYHHPKGRPLLFLSPALFLTFSPCFVNFCCWKRMFNDISLSYKIKIRIRSLKRSTPLYL